MTAEQRCPFRVFEVLGRYCRPVFSFLSSFQKLYFKNDSCRSRYEPGKLLSHMRFIGHTFSMNWCGIVGGAANSQGPLEKPKSEFILMEMTHIRADQPSQLPEGKPGAVPAARGHANTGWGATTRLPVARCVAWRASASMLCNRTKRARGFRARLTPNTRHGCFAVALLAQTGTTLGPCWARCTVLSKLSLSASLPL